LGRRPGWGEGAVGVEGDGGVEGEEAGTGGGKQFEASGVEVVGSGGEENERLLGAYAEFGNDGAEVMRFELESKDDRDGVGGPGANLAGVVDGEVGGAVPDGERFTEGAGEAFPIEFERGRKDLYFVVIDTLNAPPPNPLDYAS
jgi:hypothetical protein